MRDSVSIGFFFTDNKVTLVESHHNKPQKIVSAAVTSSISTAFDSDLTADIQLVAILQKLMRDNKINPGPVGISIPAGEVLLRSFILPWMSPLETSHAITFEAKKYVPFDLSDLTYIYHSIAFVENKKKMLRIIFYAIRKQTLEKYDRLLKQMGCKPVLFEPSPVSLAKELFMRHYLRFSQKPIAVIHVHQQHGQIIFYEKGIAYFLREFTLPLATGNESQPVDAYFVNEVSKSFDYYSRQCSKQRVGEVLLFLTIPDQKLADLLTQELYVKVRMVEPTLTVGPQKFTGLDSFYACGVCLKHFLWRSVLFNFLKEKPRESILLISWSMDDLWPILKAAVISILVLVGIAMIGRWQAGDSEKQLKSLSLKQGTFSSVSFDQIRAQIDQNKEKLDEYKKFPVRTHLATLLIHVTEALPSDVWLKSMAIHYDSKDHFVFNLEGYVFSQDFSTQVKTVNEVLSNLKTDKILSLSDAQITATQKETVNDHSVLYFKIVSS